MTESITGRLGEDPLGPDYWISLMDPTGGMSTNW